jgi:hypothetical protein
MSHRPWMPSARLIARPAITTPPRQGQLEARAADQQFQPLRGDSASCRRLERWITLEDR